MSYPKKHPLQVASDQRLLEKSQKKEQLRQLILNKFRSKYGVAPNQDNIDLFIKSQVEVLVNTEGAMSEANLKQLDKQIAERLGIPQKIKQ